MSHGYVGVQWNRNKKVYDIALWVAILTYVVGFFVVSMLTHSGAEAFVPMTLLMRAFGSLALILLTMVLCIGPLARIDSRFIPLLYNRRHMGVSMFVVALIHGVLVLIWYHGVGVINPIDSVFNSPGSFYLSSDVPFQRFGFIALMIFLLMAATSHDYWNTNLGAPVWKALHMLVYVAYALVIAHVAYGAMQDEAVGLTPALMIVSLIVVAGLHLLTAFGFSSSEVKQQSSDWVRVGAWQLIPDNTAVVVQVGNDERVAVFRYEGNKIAAVSNVCEHQNGPLGEGCVVDGLITCPWHGFQYQLEDGCSPAPFTEKIATYRVKLEGSEILLDPKPLPKGTPREITVISDLLAASSGSNSSVTGEVSKHA